MASMLVALDTAWGTRFGGINAFNTELVKSLGVQPERDFEVCCVLPQASAEDVATSAKSFQIRLLGLEYAESKFGGTAVADIRAALAGTDFNSVVWLGHDDKTGPLALQLCKALGGKAALIHHMAHGAYQGYKKTDSQAAEAKENEQRLLFRQAEYCLAVGPRLQKELKRLLSTETRRPPVAMLVPGLDDPADHEVQCLDSPPEYFTGFAAGRLGAEDDRIKQGRLALRAFAEAVAKAQKDGRPAALHDAPRMCLMGADASQEGKLRQDLEVWGEAQRHVSLLPFTEDRAAYYRKLAGSSFAMMLSWHEGFGLTGWEAIAARVPLILGKNSGLYALLRDEFQCQGEGHCIYPLDIAGHLPDGEGDENHRKEDVQAVVSAILKLADNPQDAKKAAIRLRDMIFREDWTWARTARDFMTATGLPTRNLTAAEQAPHAATEISQPETDKPDWLRVPAKPRWQPDWGLSPAVLLQAAAAVVPFDPVRQPLLDEVLAWAGAQDYPIKLRTFTGPGGTGKTRLALEVARKLQEQGWQTQWLGSEKPEDWLGQWEESLAENRSTLLVLDYAETRSTELRSLLEQALTRLQTGGRVTLRVLLLAREGGEWWSDLCREGSAATLLNGKATQQPQGIRPFSLGGGNREWRYWKHGPGTGTLYADWADALALFALSGGCRSIDEGGAWLEELGLRNVAPLAAALAERYPGHPGIAPLQPDLLAEWLLRQRLTDERGPALASLALRRAADSTLTVLGRLCAHDNRRPESVDEALAGVLALAWPALAQKAVNLAHASPPGLGKLLARAWLVLSAEQQASLATSLASPDYSVCLLDLNVAIRRTKLELAGIQKADRAGALSNLAVSLAQMGGNQARQEALACAREAVDIFRRLADAQPDSYLPALGGSLNNLAIRLSEQGDAESRQQALTCTQEAVDVYRRLADAQPDSYLPNLASYISNLGNHLSEQGDAESRQQALACLGESVDIYRHLADAHPAAYLPDLAMSLNSMGAHLSKQEDADSRQQALACARESVEIRRDLADTQPAAYLPSLAGSINNLANRLSEQGDAESLQQALTCARETVEIYRSLADTQPAAYLPDLAMSLNNLGNRLAEQGDAESRKQALACAREAVEIRRKLAEAQPAAYLPNLAGSLNNLANRLSEQGDAESRKQALACAREAVGYYGLLHRSMPAAFERNLGIAGNTLMCIASDAGLDAQAELRAVLESAGLKQAEDDEAEDET